MKKLAASILFTLGFSMACYAEDVQPSEQTAAQEATEIQSAPIADAEQEIAAATTPNGGGAMTSPGSCTSMPADQQTFASQLSADNMSMFCSKFSPDQRTAAMQMTSKPGANGTKMSPDQAVQQVMKNNNMAPMPAQPATQPKSTGGCPVR